MSDAVGLGDVVGLVVGDAVGLADAVGLVLGVGLGVLEDSSTRRTRLPLVLPGLWPDSER
ncbi:MAG: hypothetical protein H0T78_00505 [Longispora sp.]|nr:hypothetical protein [Longispora sp. (in: high G+C Gram-positive bacteria)]